MKKKLSALLAAALLVCAMPQARAESDADQHWAGPYLTAMHEIGVINPNTSGKYNPDQAIMRWEFMRYINRAFGFTEKAEINFDDVLVGDVSYETVQIATYYGYINGVGENRMNPTGTLTREQAATILGRLHKYVPTANRVLPFADRAQVSDFARDYVGEMAAQGYINGYEDGRFDPQGKLTRGQIAKILYYFLGSAMREDGKDYGFDALREDAANVTVSAPCTLRDLTVTGNLYITEGVGDEGVTLSNVNIDGDLIVSGGRVILDGVSVKNMVVSSPLATGPEIDCTGETSIGMTEVQSDCTLHEYALSVSSGGISDVKVTGETTSLLLDADVWTLETDADTVSTLQTTGIGRIHELIARGKTTVSGTGSLETADLRVAGCELEMNPTTLKLGDGLSAMVNGQLVTSATKTTVSPTTLSIDLSTPQTIASYYDITFNADPNDLIHVMLGTTELKKGAGYDRIANKNGIRIYKSAFTSLGLGVHSLALTFADNITASVSVDINNTSIGSVTPSKLTFDRNVDSAGYSDLEMTLNLPTGTTLEEVRFATVRLSHGSEYTYNTLTKRFVLLRKALQNKRADSTYTLIFVPSKGTSLSASVAVIDSTPVTTVSPKQVDFDANTKSGSYADVTIKLEPVDGATLESIRADGTLLDKDWHYRVEDDNTVIISKAALATLAEKSPTSIDLTFYMSKGVSPKVTVNFVTTLALSVSVSDDVGEPVEGALVSAVATTADNGTSEISARTDRDGWATLYVQRGTYLVTATHDRFTNPLTQTVSLSKAYSIRMAGEILEDVRVVVTNAYGALIEGASVVLGGQSVTTGADGIAVFRIRRGSYSLKVSSAGYTGYSETLSVQESKTHRIVLT